MIQGTGCTMGRQIFRFLAWFGGMTLMGVAVALAVGRVGDGRTGLSQPIANE